MTPRSVGETPPPSPQTVVLPIVPPECELPCRPPFEALWASSPLATSVLPTSLCISHLWSSHDTFLLENSLKNNHFVVIFLIIFSVCYTISANTFLHWCPAQVVGASLEIEASILQPRFVSWVQQQIVSNIFVPKRNFFRFFSSQNWGKIFASHKRVPIFVTNKHSKPWALFLCQNDNFFLILFPAKNGVWFCIAQSCIVFHDE